MSEMTFLRRNPLTGDVASKARSMTIAEASAVAERAAVAFPAWASTGPNAKRSLLNAAADALNRKANDFVEAMCAEIGATEGWARFNVMLAAGMLREAAALTTHVRGDVIPSDKPGCLALALREPLGVVLGIAPWNAPVILGVRAIATALACGNTVVFKASEVCPRTHALIVECFASAGFPENVVGCVTNAPADAAAVVEALVSHSAIKHINFTGSTRVGRIVARLAAEEIKPVLLELGGKAPMIVLEDADLDEAVKAASFGAYMNQGQICMSTERIVIVEKVADAFVAKFAAKAATMTAGDPGTAKTPLGALVDRSAVGRVEALIADAIGKGAVKLCGEAADGVLMPATAIDYVTADMRLYSEESFGPVVSILRAKDEADAVRIANDSEYGLSSAVFTKDIVRGLKVARQIKAGMCHINGATVHDEAQMPFGGVGHSGYGRFGGMAGVEQFTQLRWITVETQPSHYPI